MMLLYLLISLAIYALLLVRSIRRPNRRWLTLRVLLLTLACAGLFLAGLQPSRTVKRNSDTAILLTGRASSRLVDSLKRQEAPTYIFNFASSQNGQGLTPLPDLSLLRRQYPAVQRLLVVGDGLPPDELSKLDSLRLSFFLNTPPEGIVELHYPFQAPVGDSFSVEGRYLHTSRERRLLSLESPAGSTPLLDIQEPGNYGFKASVALQSAGRFLFSIHEKEPSGRQIRRSELPLLVQPVQKPRLLLLQTAPGFEVKYLKNWLAAQGYSLALRAAISRDRFLTEFDNRPPIDLNRINPRLLDNFDLVLLPSATLAELPPGERQALRAAVDAGLGLVILAGEEDPALSAVDRNFFYDFPRRSGGPSYQLSGLDGELSKAPFVLEENAVVFPLVRSKSDQVLAAFRLRSQGRIALGLFSDTYRLLLEGQDKAYAAIWSALIRAAARRPSPGARLLCREPALFFPQEALDFSLIDRQFAPPLILHTPDSIRLELPPRRHPQLPDQWEGRFWPRKQGWYVLKSENTAQESPAVFVQAADAWPAWRIARQLEANRRWIASRPTDISAPAAPLTEKQPFPMGWFYLMFLIGAGGLWLEERV